MVENIGQRRSRDWKGGNDARRGNDATGGFAEVNEWERRKERAGKSCEISNCRIGGFWGDSFMVSLGEWTGKTEWWEDSLREGHQRIECWPGAGGSHL